MKKLFMLSLAVAVFGIGLRAQQVINDPNVQKREVGSFQGIEVGTGVELLLTEGTAEEVAVSASSTEFRDKIVTKVENGVLKIHYETKTGAINRRKESKYLKAYVSYKTLNLLHATTGAEVKIQGVLRASALDMKANTGATIKGEVDVAALKVEQSTGSKITLTGKASALDIEGGTGSKFSSEDFVTTDCNVKVSTGAQVTLTAQSGLQVKASTGGSVKYKGNAVIKELKTSTGGSVTKIKDTK